MRKFEAKDWSTSIETRRKNRETRDATMVEYWDGCRIYKDSPPGIGWVLAMPRKKKPDSKKQSYDKRYFEKRESAEAYMDGTCCKDHAAKAAERRAKCR